MKFPSKEETLEHYYSLCDRRDALYKKVQPLEDELTKVNAEVIKLQDKQRELSEKIDDGLGRGSFIALKREIAMIAKFLRFIPPRKKSA
jgi:uncharacterized coiled-coil DUF342 family protein